MLSLIIYLLIGRLIALLDQMVTGHDDSYPTISIMLIWPIFVLWVILESQND